MFVPHISIYLFLTYIVSMAFSQFSTTTSTATSPSKIGSKVCFVYGNYDEINSCEMDTVLCDKLPHECSSYVWFGLDVALNTVIRPLTYPVVTGYFDQLTKCAKIPVFLGYGYSEFRKWSITLACCGANGTNVQDEMVGLKPYISRFGKIAGLVLRNLDIVPESPSYKDFSKNLKCYIKALKQNLPDMEVGIYLYADQFQMYYENKKQEWIDFKDLCSELAFVIISYKYFNPKCTPELKYTGIVPITGQFKYTLEKFQRYLIEAGVPKEKLLLRIPLGPVPSGDLTWGNYSVCEVNTKAMCKDPKSSAKWCSPTTADMYAKGVFVKKNAMGFATNYLELDDVYGDCQCGRSFPLFRALLDGFTGAPCPKPCRLIDER